MSLKEQIEERRRQWAEFNRWERQNPLPERGAAAVLADLSFLLSFVSAVDRTLDPDPEKSGIRKMRAALACLSHD